MYGRARALLGYRRQGLLDEHVGYCVANAAAAGDQNKARDMVTEATQTIARIKT